MIYLLAIFAYLSLLAGIAADKSRQVRNQADFAVASRSLSPWIIVLTMPRRCAVLEGCRKTSGFRFYCLRNRGDSGLGENRLHKGTLTPAYLRTECRATGHFSIQSLSVRGQPFDAAKTTHL